MADRVYSSAKGAQLIFPQQFARLPPHLVSVLKRLLMALVVSLWSVSCTSTGDSTVAEGDGFVMSEIARCSNAKARVVVSGRFETRQGVTSLLGIQAAGRAERTLYSLKGDVSRVEDSHRAKEVKAKGKKRSVKIHSYRVTLEKTELLGASGDLAVKNIVFNIIEYGPDRKKGNVRINFEPKEKAPYDWNFFISCKFPIDVQTMTAAAGKKGKAPSKPDAEPVAEPTGGDAEAQKELPEESSSGGAGSDDSAEAPDQGSEAEDLDQNASEE